MSSPFIIFCISKFSRITKNWVEDASTFSIPKKKDARKFEDMKNPLCTNSSFINSLQNVQCRFLILSKFKLYLYFLTLISFHMRHTGQNLDKILSSLYIGKRVIFDPSGKLIQYILEYLMLKTEQSLNLKKKLLIFHKYLCSLIKFIIYIPLS